MSSVPCKWANAPEDPIHRLDRDRHDRPAGIARLELASVDLEEIVVRQVNIENELALHGLEDLELFVLGWRCRIRRANVDLVRQFFGQVFAERLGVIIAQIADVHVIARGERELAPP